ncbi:MAG: hypothetical protein FWC39_11895 [Bacteroidetes bacterium]|nr:hypothetical protein [Bacteroidota bacterium]
MKPRTKTTILFFLLFTPLWGAGGLLQAQNTDTTDQGVIINGILWATRNVDAPGTFAKTPESAGMFYQWNRKIGWNATDSIVTGWDDTNPEGTTWERANDPCPTGWRVPTRWELNRLLYLPEVAQKWTSLNDVAGSWFVDKTIGDSLFIPVVGSRHNGKLGGSAGSWGFYWSCTLDESYEAKAHNANICRVAPSVVSNNLRSGFSVRCVKEQLSEQENKVLQDYKVLQENRNLQKTKTRDSLENLKIQKEIESRRIFKEIEIQNRKDNTLKTQADTTDPGVEINGITWATRNIDTFGIFAATPESAGKLYQWNRKIAWSATDSTTIDWDTTNIVGSSWKKQNDPCPDGWRVPTQKELQTLASDIEHVTQQWTTQNGVNGRTFTDKATGNSLFFPAVGSRNDNTGALGGTGAHSYYWSSTPHKTAVHGTYGLNFSESNAGDTYFFWRGGGYSVRCVLITQFQNTDTTDIGVEINGVTWATRSVETPGTFAKTPESAGMLYQWNRKTAWNVTDKEVKNWDNTNSKATVWEKENDPCPVGWRVPTESEIFPAKEEMYSLFDETKVRHEWTTQNGVTGRIFTDKATGNSLFLPAVGYRSYITGALDYTGTEGSYWSSTLYETDEANAYDVLFNKRKAGVYASYLSFGFSVRCVKGRFFVEDYKNTPKSQADTTDVGVVINGITWATRNVGATGTFAATPESAGMYYQWNRKTAWNATDNMDNTTPRGTTWERANDPCPKGWRVPTFSELLTLNKVQTINSEWITKNGVNGYIFTEKATGNSLFFPAADRRFENTNGYYWSSTTPADNAQSYLVSFKNGSSGFDIQFFYRHWGHSVRCVLAAQVQNTDTTDVGVVINGVTWATRNVGAPGTFAATPESAGMFYQWNRKKAWNVTDEADFSKNIWSLSGVEMLNEGSRNRISIRPPKIKNWNKTKPKGATWEKENDPCPQGWRVPTRWEQQRLFYFQEVTNEWTTQNGIGGRTFTDKATGYTLFLPTVGWRAPRSGRLNDADVNGCYWSSTPSDWYRKDAHSIEFYGLNAGMSNLYRRVGASVRCVLVE